MATQNTIGIGVVISDNGTAKKTIKNVEELHSTIKKTQTTAEKGVNLGGTAGSRKAVAAGYQPGGAALAASAPTGSAELMQYGQMRGSAGATGASARDFANQAQGLGGLVRLYATYAANIFAVGAAFRALSSAIDTTNMVKGLDQLGAAGGTALGSLSKRFVEATDGAVSLREAMEAVTKGSASGLADKDILRIATSAKQASQALGVDMSDAVSRLTRGITKLEPELLDELGIFIRVDDAVGAYAKSVGKSASALTDFERRAAFANSALTQAEKKFGEIKLDTNPYTKLLAVVKDTSQSVLELVNVALAPLVKLLASNPTALLTVLSGIGVLLVKQALPAIGEFRAGLRASAEQALETAKVFKESFGDEFQARLEQRFKIPDIEKQIRKAETDLSKMKFAAKMPESVSKLVAGEEYSVSKINDVLKTRNTIITTGMRGQQQASDAQVKAAKQEIAYIEKSIQLYALKQQKVEALGAAQAQADKPLGRFDPEIIAAKKYQNLQDKIASSTAIANAAQNAQITGIRGAWQLLNREVAETGTKGFAKYNTLAQGGLAAIGSRLVGLIGSFGQVGMVIAAGVAAFGLLNSWLTKTTEETKATNTSLEVLDGSYKNLNNTIENISKKDPLEAFNIQSIKARANALGDLGESTKDFVDRSFKEIKKMGAWDLSIDWVKSLWGGDVESKLSNRISSSIVKVFKNVEENSDAGKAAKASIQKLLNVKDVTSFAQVDAALAKLSDKERKNAIDQISAALKRVGDEARISAAKGEELNTAFSTLKDLRTKIATSLVPKDEMSQMGSALLEAFSKASIALEDPVQQLNTIKALSKEILEVPGTTLGEALGMRELAKQIGQVEDATVKYNQTKQKALDAEAELAELIGSRTKAEKIAAGEQVLISGLTVEGIKRFRALKAELLEIKSLEQVNLKVKTELTTEISKNMGVVEAAQLRVFTAGSKLISQGLSAEWAKAGSTIANAYASVLSGTETGIRMRANSDRAVINAQIAQIEQQRSLTIATRELTLQMQEADLQNLKQNSWGGEASGAITQKESEIRRSKLDLSAAKSGDVKGLQAKLVADLTAPGAKMSEAGVSGLEFARSIEASAAAVSNLKAQIAAINIGEAFAKFDVQTKEHVERIQGSLKSLDIEKEKLSVLKEISGEYSDAYITAKQSIDSKILETQQELELFTLRRKIEEQIKAGAPAEAAKTQAKFDQAKAQQAEVAGMLKSNQLLEKADAQYKRRLDTINRENEALKTQREITNTLEDTRASTAAILLDTAKQTEAYTGEHLQALETEKSLRETLTTAQRAQAEETSAFNLARKTALEELVRLERIGATEAATRLRTDMAQAQSMHEAKLAQIEEEKQARLRSIEEVAAYREERENFSQMIESVKSLDLVWSGVGTSITTVMAAQDEMTTSQNQYSKELEALHTKLRGLEEGSLDYKKTTQDITKTQEKQQKSEITGYAKTVGAAKSMFKEKTAAHKALAAVEKALQLKSLALEAQTLGKQIALWWSGVAAKVGAATAGEAGTTAVTTAGFLSRLPIYIKEIYASWGKMGPWMVGAATAFIAATLLSGGGKSKAAFVPSAEQRQETQGTAMSWDNQGNKVQTSRGVFGDTDAKSESIANSLERIKETSVDGLRYDNKMVDLLSKINDGINNTAKSLYSIRGLRQGSMFDTREGTTKGKGLLGSGLFGSKTSTNITDSGVLINATFADLASTTSQAAIQFYEDVTTTKKKWYGSSKTWHSRNLETADQITQDYFNDIFSNATELFKEIGQDAGMQVEQVLSSLSGVSFANLSVSLRGLKGEDLEKELNAVISSMLDQGAEAVFSQFMQFEEFGEGMLETVIRVTDNNRKVKQALSNLGIGTLRNVLGMASYEITEALVGAAGGIQDFLAKAEDYREKFLTEAERLAPIQLEVTAEIARIAKLGFTSADGLVDTRQEFKALVSSLDLTSETGRTAYTALMNVSEGFYQVTEGSQQAAEATKTALQSTIDKFKKFADDLRAFRDNLVLGSSSILTPLQKYAESKLQFESTYANALAGDEAAQGKLTNSAQTFLTASKDYFASSSRYTQDFNSVLDKVGAGIAGAEAQISIAERQLNGITEQIGLLTTINENIAYIAGVPQAATGGRVHGLTLVGERGPELVDFANPGMVYPADQTRGMFAPQASMSNNIYQVVAELRQVKQELAQLRQEQRQQTGDLIVSNYDANNRAAETISAEVALTTAQKEWQERNAPAVV